MILISFKTQETKKIMEELLQGAIQMERLALCLKEIGKGNKEGRIYRYDISSLSQQGRKVFLVNDSFSFQIFPSLEMVIAQKDNIKKTYFLSPEEFYLTSIKLYQGEYESKYIEYLFGKEGEFWVERKDGGTVVSSCGSIDPSDYLF